MQEDAQIWNDLLFSSGGKLELSKCSYHVLHFEFTPNGRPLPSLNCYNSQIHIVDRETQIQIPIKAKRAFEMHKTLGHYKSPYSSIRSSLEEVVKKVNHLSMLISMSPITRQGAQLAYATVYLPTIKYTLPQSFFPRELLDRAQSLSMARMISKSGFNRNTETPRELLCTRQRASPGEASSHGTFSREKARSSIF